MTDKANRVHATICLRSLRYGLLCVEAEIESGDGSAKQELREFNIQNSIAELRSMFRAWLRQALSLPARDIMPDTLFLESQAGEDVGSVLANIFEQCIEDVGFTRTSRGGASDVPVKFECSERCDDVANGNRLSEKQRQVLGEAAVRASLGEVVLPPIWLDCTIRDIRRLGSQHHEQSFSESPEPQRHACTCSIETLNVSGCQCGGR